MNIFKNLAQPVSQFLPPEIRKGAFPSIARAVVIDVTILFDFGGYRTIVVSAMQQSTERKVAFFVLRLVMATENSLHLAKDSTANQRFMGPWI